MFVWALIVTCSISVGDRRFSRLGGSAPSEISTFSAQKERGFRTDLTLGRIRHFFTYSEMALLRVRECTQKVPGHSRYCMRWVSATSRAAFTVTTVNHPH